MEMNESSGTTGKCCHRKEHGPMMSKHRGIRNSVREEVTKHSNKNSCDVRM